MDYDELYGHIVKLEGIKKSLFFIEIMNNNNKKFMTDLIELATIVNLRKSTKKDYTNYCKLRNEVVFIEDLYNYDGHYYGKYEFKKNHPLLFTKTKDIIDNTNTNQSIDQNSRIHINTMTNKILEIPRYVEIVNDRLTDNKLISDNETLADKFMLIEKDIDYGYALTAHKSQGSTYDVVYVYNNDFNVLVNIYNSQFRCTELRNKEKNQLRYVAFTRAKTILKLFNF